VGKDRFFVLAARGALLRGEVGSVKRATNKGGARRDPWAPTRRAPTQRLTFGYLATTGRPAQPRRHCEGRARSAAPWADNRAPLGGGSTKAFRFGFPRSKLRSGWLGGWIGRGKRVKTSNGRGARSPSGHPIGASGGHVSRQPSARGVGRRGRGRRPRLFCRRFLLRAWGQGDAVIEVIG